MVLAMTSDDAAALAGLQCSPMKSLASASARSEGVSQVIIGGGAKSAVRVQINPPRSPRRASAWKTFAQPSQVNVYSPKGALDGEQHRFVIASNDQLFEAEQLSAAHRRATQRRGGPLRDVGTAIDGAENTPAGRPGQQQARRAPDHFQATGRERH